MNNETEESDVVKLYTVRVSYEFVIVASDDEDANLTAWHWHQDGLHSRRNEIQMDIQRGVHAKGWTDDVCPVNYDRPGDKTIGDYKKEGG
jgi:hypothetical protein